LTEILNKIEKHWKHWAIFQYIDSETLNSIQCQCWKLKHWKPTQCKFICQFWFFDFFNVSMLVSMFNVYLQTLTAKCAKTILPDKKHWQTECGACTVDCWPLALFGETFWFFLKDIALQCMFILTCIQGFSIMWRFI